MTMVVLYKYIFASTYFWTKDMLKSGNRAFMNSSMVVALLIIFNAVVVLNILSILVYNTSITLIINYYVFGGISFVILTLLFLRRDDRYKNILEEVESYSEKRKKKLKFASISYSTISAMLYAVLMYQSIQNL